MLRKIGIIAVLSLIVVALAAVPALAANPHQPASAEPITCTQNADFTVTCTGDLAGLGNVDNIDVFVDVAAGCSTSGSLRQPRGHIQGGDTDIPVNNGRATFNVTTESPDCPPGLNPVVGNTATVTVTDSATDEVLFTQTVTIVK
jgi:hypothetical protein